MVRRLLWNVLPLAGIVGVVATTLLGDDGLLQRDAVWQRLHQVEGQVKQVKADNARLRAQVRALREDPAVVRRIAAEELLIAEPGSTIYRFEPSSP